jgi:hypothetical protein
MEAAVADRDRASIASTIDAGFLDLQLSPRGGEPNVER